jgi:hypothetical protein
MVTANTTVKRIFFIYDSFCGGKPIEKIDMVTLFNGLMVVFPGLAEAGKMRANGTVRSANHPAF